MADSILAAGRIVMAVPMADRGVAVRLDARVCLLRPHDPFGLRLVVRETDTERLHAIPCHQPITLREDSVHCAPSAHEIAPGMVYVLVEPVAEPWREPHQGPSAPEADPNDRAWLVDLATKIHRDSGGPSMVPLPDRYGRS